MKEKDLEGWIKLHLIPYFSENQEHIMLLHNVKNLSFHIRGTKLGR